MSKIIQLKDKVTHEVAYPTTHVDAVYDNNGRDLPTILTDKADIDDLSNVLAEQVLDNTRDGINALTREEAKKDLFIDMWNAVCGNNGRYNATTGYFELNGLTDITYLEAINIYEIGQTVYPNPAPIDNTKIRTNIIPLSTLASFDKEADVTLFCRSSSIEVLRISNDEYYGVKPRNTFNELLIIASKLKHILGCLNMKSITSMTGSVLNANTLFPLLETFKIKNLKVSISLAGCPKLSLESLQYLVTYAANTSPITVTVHANVYAKLTDETNTEWNSLLSKAQEKNIQFVTI